MGGAFERLFCPEGREFEQANLQKFKCPGDCPGGCGSFNLTATLQLNNCYTDNAIYLCVYEPCNMRFVAVSR